MENVSRVDVLRTIRYTCFSVVYFLYLERVDIMKKGLIMDMDGVVVDSELVYVKKFMTWFKKQGIEKSCGEISPIRMSI